MTSARVRAELERGRSTLAQDLVRKAAMTEPGYTDPLDDGAEADRMS